MKREDMRAGTWARMSKAITNKGSGSLHDWSVGEIVLIKELNPGGTLYTIVSASDPKKREDFGGGLWSYFEDKPVANPFESGPGINARELPTGRPEPFVAKVTERDLLPDV